MFYKLSDDWQELSNCTINQWLHERVLVLCCCKQQEGALSWWKWSLWAGIRYQDRRSHIRRAQYKIFISSKILNHLNNTTPDCLSEYHWMTCRCIYLLTLQIYFKSAETSTISYVIDSIGQYSSYSHSVLVFWFKVILGVVQSSVTPSTHIFVPKAVCPMCSRICFDVALLFVVSYKECAWMNLNFQVCYMKAKLLIFTDLFVDIDFRIDHLCFVWFYLCIFYIFYTMTAF